MTDNERDLEAYVNTLTDEECIALWESGGLNSTLETPLVRVLLLRAYLAAEKGRMALATAFKVGFQKTCFMQLTIRAFVQSPSGKLTTRVIYEEPFL